MRLCNYIDLTWFSIVAMRWRKHVRFNVETLVLSQWPLAERPPPLRYGKTTTQLRWKDRCSQSATFCSRSQSVGADGQRERQMDRCRFTERREDQSSLRSDRSKEGRTVDQYIGSSYISFSSQSANSGICFQCLGR